MQDKLQDKRLQEGAYIWETKETGGYQELAPRACSDEPIHTQGDKDKDAIHPSIMQSSNCEGKISTWNMEFDLEEDAY